MAKAAMRVQDLPLPDPASDVLLTPNEACGLIKCTRGYLQRITRAGLIRRVYLPNSQQPRYFKSDLVGLLFTNMYGPGEASPLTPKAKREHFVPRTCKKCGQGIDPRGFKKHTTYCKGKNGTNRRKS